MPRKWFLVVFIVNLLLQDMVMLFLNPYWKQHLQYTELQLLFTPLHNYGFLHDNLEAFNQILLKRI